MIVACSSCSAQYTVADAKVRGRKVRVTCKHCRTTFVIDATEKAPEPLRLPNLESLMGSDEVGDDATRVAARPDFSVHDEPTVIGQIPAAALEAERRYAQRTLPPPANASAPPVASERVPEGPTAPVTSERALPPYSSEPTLLIPTPLAVQSAPPPPPSPEPTLLSADDLESALQPSSPRPRYLLVALILILVAVVVVALTVLSQD